MVSVRRRLKMSRTWSTLRRVKRGRMEKDSMGSRFRGGRETVSVRSGSANLISTCVCVSSSRRRVGKTSESRRRRRRVGAAVRVCVVQRMGSGVCVCVCLCTCVGRTCPCGGSGTSQTKLAMYRSMGSGAHEMEMR